MRALALLAIAGACGDSHVVLELATDVPGAERVEVLLLEKVVLAKKQRHNREPTNTPDDGLEVVFYMTERSRTTVELEGRSTAGLQFEIKGAGDPYVPLVAAVTRDPQIPTRDKLLALGVYNPAKIFEAQVGREHAAAAVVPVSDVTVYPIELEKVDKVFALSTAEPLPVGPREVMNVACGPDTGGISGFAWRRTDLRQLRVMIARPGMDGNRLDPPDLDCDRHSPGTVSLTRHVPGDELDCDDTAAFVHGGGREQCSKHDEDCNPNTTLSRVPCIMNTMCQPNVCVCDDDTTVKEACLPGLFGTEGCKLPAEATGGSREPCDGAGFAPLPPVICPGVCEAMVAWATPGLEVGLGNGPGLMSVPLGRWAPIQGGRAYLTVRSDGTRPFTDSLEIILRVKAGAAITNHAIPISLFGGPCGSPSLLDCPGG